MRIMSWNMQNEVATSTGKLIALESLIKFYDLDVLLIQESGVPDSTGFRHNKIYKLGTKHFQCINFIDPVAKELRSTTSILVNIELNFATWEHLDLTFYRPSPYIIINEICIATVHSVEKSNWSVDELKNLIAHYNKQRNFDKWILIGDFNSLPSDFPTYFYGEYLLPDEVNQIHIRGTKTNYEDYDCCDMIYPKAPTQGPLGMRLNIRDFVFSKNLEFDMINDTIICNEYMSDGEKIISDHNAIIVDIKETGRMN